MLKRLGVFLAGLTVACFALLGVISLPTIAQNVACYMQQGGASWNAGSGCTWSVKSGGVLNIESGGALQIGGVDVTTGAGGSNVAGVGAGYKLARGETAADGSNPTPVTTGLTTIVACAVSPKITATGTGTAWATYTTSSGTLSFYVWKITADDHATIIASTGTETVGWICVGT